VQEAPPAIDYDADLAEENMEKDQVRGRAASVVQRCAVGLLSSALLAACGGQGSNQATSVLPSTLGAASHTGVSGVNPDVTTTIVYLGGAGIPAKAYREWFDYYGVALPPDPQGAASGLPINNAYEYYFDADGAGNGATAFLSQTPDATIPSVPPYPCPGQVTTCLPYPEWDGSSIDGQLTSAQISCYQAGCGSVPAAQPARGQYLQLPTLETDLPLPYNPNGQTVPSGGLQLSRNSYCGIWEGGITSWADPSITSDNGGVQVSTQPIQLIVRSDSAGATLLLTQHLDTVCQGLPNPAYDWTRGVGTSGISWPSNTSQFKGNGGIVSGVTATAGSIGYVGPSYIAPVVAGGLPSALLLDQYYFAKTKLKFVGATVTSTLDAFKGIQPPTNTDPWDFGLTESNPAQQGAYPIVGFVYLETYECYKNAKTATGIQDVVKWYTKGGATGSTPADQILEAQGFAPLSSQFKTAVHNASPNVVKGPVTNVCTI
jgi:phosphate transport system substrate-binding protein